MLIEQDQLIQDYGSQGQQLRPLQALDRHLDAPLKDILEQAIEGFNGLRPQLMKDLAHFYPAIAMRMGPASSRHQFPTSSLALVPQLGIVVMGVTQHVAHLPRQLVQQDRGDLIVPPIRNGQLGSQRDPHHAYGDSEVQLPPIPPAMPARFAPPGLSINRGMRADALLPMFF